MENYESLKENDQVYITWPGGSQTGPFPIQAIQKHTYQIRIGTDTLLAVPKMCCKLAEPEIEEGRLYWVDSRTAIVVGNRALPNMIKEPVHHRWNELNRDDVRDFVKLNNEWGGSPKEIFYEAYKLITSVEHP